MSDKNNCLNCSLLDKEKRCCKEDYDEIKLKDYELEACTCTNYVKMESEITK